MQRRQRLLVGALVVPLLIPTTAPALAVDDLTPPVGSVAVVHDDRDAELVRLSVPATDDLSGVATVEVSGNGTTWASYPYAPLVDWAVFDPASGGSPGLGRRVVRVRWVDGVGNTSSPVTTTLDLFRNGALETPRAPITGNVFTMRPVFSPGETPASDENCTWELRWGNERARRVFPNETFGSQTVIGDPGRGYCGAWAITLPWVPVPEFEIYFSWAGRTGFMTFEGLEGELPVFHAAVASTDRRIRSSNLPVVQILPDKYTVVVGEKVTYQAFPIGTTLRSNDLWAVYHPELGLYKMQWGGSTFSFRPPANGTWLVAWNGATSRPYAVGATYDPRARNPDRSAPNTTPPKQRITGGTPGATVPVTLEWSGSDVGWGIERFRLQRSIDGGAWTSIGLPTPKTKSIVQHLTPGHSYRFRVRAIDKAGNVGAWDEGPLFKPKLISDASSGITYRQPWFVEVDATAIGGGLHHASAAGASATFKFQGRDVAWIAERGPAKGRVKVYVDGVLRSTVDLGAAADGARLIVFRRHWSTVGTHVIKLVVEGTAGRPIGTLDAFAVLR